MLNALSQVGVFAPVSIRPKCLSLHVSGIGTMNLLYLLLVVALSQMRKVESMKITSKTWDETTKNKVILVKLCTRICAHCLEIKKDWDKLSSMYDGHEVCFHLIFEYISLSVCILFARISVLLHVYTCS